MKALLKYALRNLWRMKFRSLALFAVLFLLSAAAVVGLISARSTASEAERIRFSRAPPRPRQTKKAGQCRRPTPT